MPSMMPSSGDFEIAAPARLQVSRLSHGERHRLNQLLASPPGMDVADAFQTRRTPAGHFVSRLSQAKRVLWTKTGDGRSTVLSIADRSYSLD